MMKRLSLSIFLVLTLAGCAGLETKTAGPKIDRSQILNIKPGTTTRQYILDTFGNPTEVSLENNEEKMTYVFKEKKTPSYLGGLVENEVQSSESVTTLEVVLRENIVYSYRFKSSEN